MPDEQGRGGRWGSHGPPQRQKVHMVPLGGFAPRWLFAPDSLPQRVTIGQTCGMHSRTCSKWPSRVRFREAWLAQESLARSRTPLGLRPYCTSKGDNHSEAWGSLRTAKCSWGRIWSQFFPSVSMAFLSICLKVLLNLSTSPSCLT